MLSGIRWPPRMYSQKTVEEFRKVRDEFKLRYRVEHGDPRDKKAARERADDIYSVREQRDEVRERECLARFLEVLAIRDIIRVRDKYAVTVRFVRLLACFFRLGILRDVHGRGLGDDIFEQAIEELCAVLDRQLGVCCKLHAPVSRVHVQYVGSNTLLKASNIGLK